jgi:parvulin-like peptidyl-prolyl isomerase
VIFCAAFAGRALGITEIGNYIAAIVNDSVITYQDVHDASLQSIIALRQIYGRQLELLRAKEDNVKNEALESLVAKTLIVDEFKSSVGVVPENMLDNQISQQIRKQYVDRQNFRNALRRDGISFEKYRKMTHDNLVMHFMIERNVRSAIIISPQKIESYYTNHLEEYKVGNQVKLRMIVLKSASAPTMTAVKKLGQELVKQLDGGASFPEMAAIYSEGSEKREGGDWGWVDKKLRQGLADVAFALKPGERSGLIARANGDGNEYSIYRYDAEGRLIKALKYREQGDKEQLSEEKDFANDPAGAAAMAEPQEFYLMLVEDKRTSHTKTLAEVKDDIEKNLSVEERNRLQKQWIERLKAKAFVRYPGN